MDGDREVSWFRPALTPDIFPSGNEDCGYIAIARRNCPRFSLPIPRNRLAFSPLL